MKIKHDGWRVIVSDLPVAYDLVGKTISCDMNPRADIPTNLSRAAKQARREASLAIQRAELFEAAARQAHAEGIK